mgnify:CR=1 FL=1
MGEDRMTRWSRDQRKQDSAWATGWRATTWRAGAGALWTAGLIIGVASSPAGQGEVVVAGGEGLPDRRKSDEKTRRKIGRKRLPGFSSRGARNRRWRLKSRVR